VATKTHYIKLST